MEVWFARLDDLLEGSEVSAVSGAPLAVSFLYVVLTSPAPVVDPPVVVFMPLVVVSTVMVPSDVVTVSEAVPSGSVAVVSVKLPFVTPVRLPLSGSVASIVTLAGVSSHPIAMVTAPPSYSPPQSPPDSTPVVPTVVSVVQRDIPRPLLRLVQMPFSYSPFVTPSHLRPLGSRLY